MAIIRVRVSGARPLQKTYSGAAAARGSGWVSPMPGDVVEVRLQGDAWDVGTVALYGNFPGGTSLLVSVAGRAPTYVARCDIRVLGPAAGEVVLPLSSTGEVVVPSTSTATAVRLRRRRRRVLLRRERKRRREITSSDNESSSSALVDDGTAAAAAESAAESSNESINS